MKKIILVVGARPNFIKIAPLHRALCRYSHDLISLICHTGQHFDQNMSKIFFEELALPEPHFFLGVGGGSHADQTGRIMIGFEKILEREKPDLVIVPGDVNSTLACSVVAAKTGTHLAHVEAGLRSFDRSMPEEINRIVTDILCDYLFVSEPSGLINLRKEGIDQGKIFYVGNIMIDSLVQYQPRIMKSTVLKQLHLRKKEYILVTFHRPNNVDTRETLSEVVEFLNRLARRKKIVFPVHPRTMINLKKYELRNKVSNDVILLDPVGYIDFLQLTRNAGLVITDSGGIQEETTYLSVPCITIRDNTERPVTVETGTNVLAGTNLPEAEKEANNILNGKMKKGSIPELWDGKTAERIASIIMQKLVVG